MRQRLLSLLLIMAGLAVVPVPALAAEPRIVTVSWNGAWTWYQDPRALSFKGSTYVGVVTNRGAIVVRRVSHATGAMSTYTIAPAGTVAGWDDHSAPSLLITPAERLAVFWTGHSYTDVRYRVSAPRLDLTKWSAERRLTGSGLVLPKDGDPRASTYTHAVYRPQDGRVYLFTRYGVRRDYYMTTTRDLVRWTPGIKVLRNDVYHLDDSRPLPYLKVAPDNAGRIHLAVQESNTRSSTVAAGRTGLHHMYLAGGLSGSFRRSDGSLIRTVAAVRDQPLVAREGTVVHDDEADGAGPARLYDVAVDDSGRPTVAYTAGARRYWWARWDPESGTWKRSLVASTTNEPRGIALAERETTRLYYISSAGSVMKATTADGGDTWQQVRLSSTTSARRPATPAFITYPTVTRPTPSPTSPVEVLWMQGSWTSFNKFSTWIKAYGRLPHP